ncbi:cysteine protease rdl2-related [Anaeramoeba ignava]|uniref:Cysteine protease rdl2-related n=1 Tax=Anaeramoeba ignava TaxID=1746090 RepID=A0A9Q0R7X6_ANAIG|nr:cysteine protease rdl2-related [Anaeramoeba ignava]
MIKKKKKINKNINFLFKNRDLFNKFKNDFNKHYSEEEEAIRYKIFSDNVKMINKHNSEEHNYKLGINGFTDLTNAEYQSLYLRPMEIPDLEIETVDASGLTDTPSSYDCRNYGEVTPVKNQNPCGSCWSFSATGVIEGCGKIGSGKLNSVSEQELVDCDDDDNGCSGGWPKRALDWVKNNGGICSESAYPYQAVQGTCKKTSCSSVSTVGSAYYATPNNPEVLKSVIYTYGPVSVAIDASSTQFSNYRGGVFDYPSCGTAVNHAVLVVGYGHDYSVGLDYWIIKNSWGTSWWGAAGYMNMKRTNANDAGMCGILQYPVFATGCTAH